MRMKFYPILCFLLLFLIKTIKAQDTTSFYGKSQYIFEHVDKNQISSGLLSEYGIEFLELANYNGTVLSDSNYVGMEEWRMLYTSLYSAQINNNVTMYGLDTVNNRVLSYIALNQPISFSVLHYNYQSLRSDAVSANLLSVSNDQLYDVPARSQSPYQNNQVFAVAPIRQAAVLGNNDLVFRPELFFANTGKTVSAMAISVGDTTSYQSVSFNTPLTLNFTQAGFVDINIRLTYTDASICYAHTKLLVYPEPSGYGEIYGRGVHTQAYGFGAGGGTITNENITATKSYLGQTATGDITIQFASTNNTGHIRKPLIVVEGFDINNDYDFESFTDNLGFDFNLDPIEPITLNDSLDNANDYDLIFLNFANATDYIQRNAYLLEKVIAEINSRKTTYNSQRQDNVIIGLSMGGLVARYALRDMELNSVNHETRLFISHDTPHHGANVPVGAQAAVQHLAPFEIFSPSASSSFPYINIKWDDLFPDLVTANNSFNTPAAKQMLIQRYVLNPINYSLVADNSASNSFFTEINNMGWPTTCKNLTLSNGACNGTKIFPDNSRIFEMIGSRSMTYGGSLWRSAIMTVTSPVSPILVYGGNINPLSLLVQFPLSIFSTKSSVNLDFRINAVPSSGVGEVYRGDIYIKRKIVWIINSTSYIMKTRINSISGTLPLDNAQGGLYDVETFGFDLSELTGNLPPFFSGINAVVLQPRFCFVPTVSSLAIANPWQNLNSNIYDNVSCLTPPGLGVRNYYTPQQSQLHISYTQASANWILQWQDADFDCAEVCVDNLSISGTSDLCTTPATYTIPSLPAGTTISWSISPANIVTSAVNGNSITLTPIHGGYATLTASLTTACGNLTYSKGIFINIPETEEVGFTTYGNSSSPLLVYLTYGGVEAPSTAPEAYFETETLDGTQISENSWPSPYTYCIGSQVYVHNFNHDVPIRIRYHNECGITDWKYTTIPYNPYYYYSVFPNPTQSTLTVSNKGLEKEDTKKHSAIAKVERKPKAYEISLYDDQMKIWHQQKSTKGDDISFDTHNIPNGTYYLHIQEGKTIIKKQIIIEH